MDNSSTSLLSAANASASPKKPSVVPLYRQFKVNDPAVENKVYRDEHPITDKPVCTLKLITNSRIFGVRGHGGSTLAKSAIRLAIDTGVKSPSTFESSSLRSKSRIKPLVINDLAAEKAVNELDNFEKVFGGKASGEFKRRMDAYKRAKADELLKLSISTTREGKPLFKDEATQAAYFKDMEALSFSYYEVYLSVQPRGGRATRSKAFRTMTIEELRVLFPEFKFEILV